MALIPLSNERLHCGDAAWPSPLDSVSLIPLSNERLHCGAGGSAQVVA